MAGRLPKTTNFFHSAEPAAAAALSNLKSGILAGTKWTWASADAWQDSTSQKFIMSVGIGMELEHVGKRRYRVNLPGVKQYVRNHRFVYKLDAFTKNNAGDLVEYLFTVATPRFLNTIDQYGVAANLVIEGRVALHPFTPANVVWVRRGVGEWRD